MFEWDDAKNAANRLKRGLSFDEAVAMFDGPVLSRADDRFAYGASRMSLSSLWFTLIAMAERDLFRHDLRAIARGNCMTSISDKRRLELAALAARPDAAIDFSDIAELDEIFFETATLVEPDSTEHVTLRVKKSVVDAYRRQGKGHTSRMSSVLETYAKAKLR